MVRVALRKDSRRFRSSDINSFARDIEPHVIVDTRTWKGRHDFARIGGEHEELGRSAGGDKQPVIRLIEDHRIGGFRFRNGPTRNQFPRVQVNDSDLFRAR